MSIDNTDRVFDFEIAAGHTTLLFVRRGGINIVGTTTTTKTASLGLADVAIMSLDGTKVSLQANEKGTQVLVLSGQPLNEPIAARGPFVMNTQQELSQAMEDYHYGRNGFDHF